MTPALATLRASFSPLRYPNFRLYLGGQLISLIGTWLQVTAQSWVVWELTGSNAALGVVQMLSSLPLLILAPWAGVLADQIDRRRLLIVTQIGAMSLALTLAGLTGFGIVQVWHIYVLALLLGIVTTLELPAQQAFLGDLAGMDEVRKAVNLNAMIIQVSRMLGPAVAGVMVARLGPAPAFLLNGLSFLAVIISLVVVRARQVRSHSKTSGALQQMHEALRFVRTQPRIQDMIVFSGISTFFILSIILSQLPAVADQVLGGDAETLGILMGASGAGALMSVIFIVPLAQAQPRSGIVLAVAAIWAAIWLIAFSQMRTVIAASISLFFGSLGAPVIFTTTLGLTQLMSPQDMRARVISLFTMVSFGMQPVAFLVVGWFAEHYGVQNAILVNAVAILVACGLIMSLRGDLRRWVRTTAPIPEPAIEQV
jgi:MFS family permease